MRKHFIILSIISLTVTLLSALSACSNKSSTSNTTSTYKSTVSETKETTIKPTTTTRETTTTSIYDTLYPKFYVETDGGKTIDSKETYIGCSISVSDSEYSFEDEPAQIRGRGNSTWNWEKKPYRIKFDSKVDLFGNGKAKSWTLIANYCDLSLSRNYLAYRIAESLDDLEYTTSTQQVELYLNGEYQGLYLVCEQIQTGKNRIDIEEELSDDPKDTGYLIESDFTTRCQGEGKVEGKNYFTLGGVSWICYDVKTPDIEEGNVDQKYFDYIKSYFEEFYGLLNGETSKKTYEKICNLIDVNTFADTYIVSELFNNADCGWSMYFYKDANSKLCSGPLWDFDISSGNCGYQPNSNDPTYLWAKETTAIYQYLLKFSDFRLLIKTKLIKYRYLIKNVIKEEKKTLLAHEEYFNRNFEKWNILTTGVNMGSDPVCTEEELSLGTWKDNLLYLTDWLNQSLDYMYSYYVE